MQHIHAHKHTALVPNLSSINNKLGFSAALVNSIIPFRGELDSFSRASGATVKDFEGLVKTIDINEARFVGARRVKNIGEIIHNLTKALDWVVSYVDAHTIRIVATPNSGTGILIGSGTIAANDGRRVRGNIEIRLISGSIAGSNFNMYRGHGAATSVITHAIPTDGSWGTITVDAIDVDIPGNIGIIDDQVVQDYVIEVRNLQYEDVAGQINENPSEYVSIGAEVLPYHGANVDSVKYFRFENGNTVLNNVVTKTPGPVILKSILKGIIIEDISSNYADTNEPYTQTVTLPVIGDFTVSCKGNISYTVTLGTATGTISVGICTEDSPVHLNLTVAGTIVLIRNSGNTDITSEGDYIVQVENLPFLTSFIPSPGVTIATRSNDQLSYFVPTVFASGNWDTGTILATMNGPPTNTGVYSITLYGLAHAITLGGNADNNAQSVIFDGGVTSLIGTALVPDTRQCVAFDDNGSELYADGVSVDTDLAIRILDFSSIVAKISIGHNETADKYTYGSIKDIEVYNARLSTIKCLGLTA